LLKRISSREHRRGLVRQHRRAALLLRLLLSLLLVLLLLLRCGVDCVLHRRSLVNTVLAPLPGLLLGRSVALGVRRCRRRRASSRSAGVRVQTIARVRRCLLPLLLLLAWSAASVSLLLLLLLLCLLVRLRDALALPGPLRLLCSGFVLIVAALLLLMLLLLLLLLLLPLPLMRTAITRRTACRRLLARLASRVNKRRVDALRRVLVAGKEHHVGGAVVDGALDHAVIELAVAAVHCAHSRAPGQQSARRGSAARGRGSWLLLLLVLLLLVSLLLQAALLLLVVVHWGRCSSA
jgi:hypothetical protein